MAQKTASTRDAKASGPIRADDFGPGVRIGQVSRPGRPTMPRPLRRDVEALFDGRISDRWKDQPRRRVKSGTVLQPLELRQDELAELITSSLGEGGERVVWAEGGSEVLVDFKRTQVAIAPGLVIVALELHAHGQRASEVTVPLAIGTPDRIRGLLAVTPRAPEGPAALTTRWGDAVIAAVWGAFVDVVAELAEAAGEDEAGAPLEPAAFVAEQENLGIVLQARPTLIRRDPGLQTSRHEQPSKARS